MIWLILYSSLAPCHLNWGYFRRRCRLLLLAHTSVVTQLISAVTDPTYLSHKSAAHNTHSFNSQKNSNHYMMVLSPHPLFLHQTNHVTTQAKQDIKVTSLVSNMPYWTLKCICIFYYPFLPFSSPAICGAASRSGRSQYGMPQLYDDYGVR